MGQKDSGGRKITSEVSAPTNAPAKEPLADDPASGQPGTEQQQQVIDEKVHRQQHIGIDCYLQFPSPPFCL